MVFIFMLQPNKQFIPGGLFPGRLIYITATPGPKRYILYFFNISFTDMGVLIRPTVIIDLKFLL